MSDFERKTKLKDLIPILRSVVLTRKPPCPLFAVLQDFKEVEGRDLPYRALGFKSPVDLLESTNEFQIKRQLNEVYICAKQNSKSDHIAKLVREQKSSGHKTRLAKVVQSPRQLKQLNSREQLLQQRHLQYQRLFHQQQQQLRQQQLRQPQQPQQQQQKQSQHHQQQQQQQIQEQKYINEPLLHQNFKEQIKEKIQKELEKHQRQLQLEFDKEKQELKQILAELKASPTNSPPRVNDDNKSHPDIVRQNEALTVELKDLKERLRKLELNKESQASHRGSKSSTIKCGIKRKIDDDLTEQELEEDKFMIAELKHMEKRLAQLSLDANNNSSVDYKMLKTPEKSNTTKSATPQKPVTQKNEQTSQKAQVDNTDKKPSQPMKDKQQSPQSKSPTKKVSQTSQSQPRESLIKKQITNSQQKSSQTTSSTKTTTTGTNLKERIQNVQSTSAAPTNSRNGQIDNGTKQSDLREFLDAKRALQKQQQSNKSTSASDSSSSGLKEMKQSESNKNTDRVGRPILGQNNNGRSQHPNRSNHNFNQNQNQNHSNNNGKVPKQQQQQQPQAPQFPPPQQQWQEPSTVMMPPPQPLMSQQFYMPSATSQTQNVNQQPQRRVAKYPSVQHRLQLNLKSENNSVNGNGASQTITTPQTPTPPITTSTENLSRAPKFPNIASPTMNTSTSKLKAFKFDPRADPCKSIANYCYVRKFGEPKYNVFRSKKGLFDCQLVINQYTIYSTYPQEYTSEAVARVECAKKAIQQIQTTEARNLLPTYPNDKDFLDVLYNELLQHPNGIISDKMLEWFVDKFNYTMPEHWFLLVQNSRRFIVENGIRETTFIILANPDVKSEDISVLDVITTTPVEMEQLKLPWTKKYWELYVTHCASTVEIWACLLGPEYNTRFESLMSDINRHMINNKIRPDVIAPKHIYLVETRSSWQRIRVESLDRENETALCFYIDYGDTENLPVNELHLCDPQFLWLAPQAVPFSLFGLEDFAGNPHAIQHLEKHLYNSTVIGEVITKEAEFEANSTIQMIMFDTSTDDDINLNLLLQDEICRVAQPPKLKEQGMTTVTITNIDNDNGDVSLQIINADSEYVQRALKHIVKSKLNHDQHKCIAKDLLKQQLLLVHDDERNVGGSEWYRAKVVDLRQAENIARGHHQTVDVVYIDYDIKRTVHISKIYRLESLSTALSKFPTQAIRVKLHNIPEMSPNIIGRMRALLPENCQAFVRVEKFDFVPHVTILHRVDGPDMPYCNINDDLRLEIERSKDATLYLKTTTDGSSSMSGQDVTTSPTQLFRSQTLASAPMLPLKIGELPKLRNYDEIPALNSTFNVYVIMVSNPLTFTVQPYNADFQHFQKMMVELQDYCVNNDAYIPVDMVEIGQAYAAKNVDSYYRVIVKARYGEMINVSYCDFGDSGTIRSDHLKVLPLKFRQLPIMGINARLWGIKGHSDDVWSTDDVQRFRNLVLGKKMASFVKSIDYDSKGMLDVTLDLVDVSGDEDVNIRELLLDENRVLPL